MNRDGYRQINQVLGQLNQTIGRQDAYRDLTFPENYDIRYLDIVDMAADGPAKLLNHLDRANLMAREDAELQPGRPQLRFLGSAPAPRVGRAAIRHAFEDLSAK